MTTLTKLKPQLESQIVYLSNLKSCIDLKLQHPELPTNRGKEVDDILRNLIEGIIKFDKELLKAFTV